jgi:hypothetical protein
MIVPAHGPQKRPFCRGKAAGSGVHALWGRRSARLPLGTHEKYCFAGEIPQGPGGPSPWGSNGLVFHPARLAPARARHEEVVLPFVPVELWEAAQKTLCGPDGPRAGRRTQRFLLGNGLLRCGQCGATLIVRRDRKGYGYYKVYICGGPSSGAVRHQSVRHQSARRRLALLISRTLPRVPPPRVRCSGRSDDTWSRPSVLEVRSGRSGGAENTHG